MKRIQISGFFVLLTLLVMAPFSTAAAQDPVIEALQASQWHADFRLRYEHVDDSVNDDGEALTLRSRAGFTSGQAGGFSVLGEFVDVRIAGGFADYAPNRAGFATIADPETTGVNRALIRYQGVPTLNMALGRQRVIHDNARFVGNVGWRQNEQTFDAFTAAWQPNDDLTGSYGYLYAINGITPAFDADTDSHLFNVRYSGLGAGALTAYGYFLEDEDSGDESDTAGLRFNGARQLDTARLLYTAEYASQETDQDFEAAYTFIELGVALPRLTAKVGREVMGSDDGAYGFQTPLATKHAFNGWADKFLSTPVDGLHDRFVTLSTRAADINLLAAYHQYEADEGSADYGTEWNLQAVRVFGENYTLGTKYASYSADEHSDDTGKFWLWGELRF